MMQFRRKKIIFMTFVMLGFAIVLLYLFTGKLFDGNYDERQRQLWNSIVEENIPGTPVTQKTYIDLRFNHEHGMIKRINEKQLWQIEKNQELYGPCWSVEPDIHVNINHLPVRGLTTEELIQRVNKLNDADACLEICNRQTQDYLTWIALGRKQLYEWNKQWLSKAVDFDKKGAVFLLELIKHYESLLPSYPGRHDNFNEKPWIQKIGKFYLLKGYEEFLEALQHGDMELFRCLTTIDPSFFSLMESDLFSTDIFNRKTPESRLNWAEYIITSYQADSSLGEKIKKEMELPKKPWSVTLSRYFSLQTTQNQSHLYDQGKEAAIILKQSADGGNIDAMYLWVTWAAAYMAPFDKATWNDLLQYADILVQRGHTGFSYRFSGNFSFPMIVLKKYYQENSQVEVLKQVSLRLAQRGELPYMQDELVKSVSMYIDSLEKGKEISFSALREKEILSQINRLYSLFPQFAYTWGYYPVLLDDHLGKPIQTRVLEIISEGCQKQNPAALIAMAFIYQKGLGVQPDLNRECDLLEQAWARITWPEFLTLRFIRNKKGIVFDASSNRSFVYKRLIELYSMKGMPFYQPQKAFQLTTERYEELTRDDETAFDDGTAYTLASMYEKGQGTSQSPAKAAFFYMIGALNHDFDCYVPVAKIFEAGQFVKQNNKIALVFYSKYLEPPETIRSSQNIELQEIWRKEAEEAVSRLQKLIPPPEEEIEDYELDVYLNKGIKILKVHEFK